MSIKQHPRVLAISGSTRKDSVNGVILETIRRHYEQTLTMQIYQGIDRLPHFNPDLLSALPAEVKSFYALIAEADAVIICSPEYVFSMPGSLKNALEWTVSTVLFSDKPLAIVVASSVGEKAFESLDLVMTTLGANTSPQTKVLISGAASKYDKTSGIVNQDVEKDIFAAVDALIGLIV